MAPVTASLVGVCLGVFALEYAFHIAERPDLLSRWALSRDGLASGMWWTVVTHMFLHANLLHLMVNVLGLWFIGPEVEMMLGRSRYLLLYFISGIAGGLLQTAFAAPSSELVGASGALCGVLLSFTTAYPEMPLQALLFFVLPVRMKAKTLGRGLVLLSLLFAMVRFLPQIGHLAHLGGALAGAFLTWWWLPSSKARRPVPVMRGDPQQRTDELLARVVEEGIEGLSREERRQLERLADRGGRRRGA
ncbi:MAG: rhomboid family intramembrane serine protease [Chthoniobacterales bacterium]|nr:rhomboid family intramembrane serine protease [Chthoniobacterales bacterium]